jgi:hypothetical protein
MFRNWLKTSSFPPGRELVDMAVVGGTMPGAGRGTLILPRGAGRGALVSAPQRPCQPCLHPFSAHLFTHSFIHPLIPDPSIHPSIVWGRLVVCLQQCHSHMYARTLIRFDDTSTHEPTHTLKRANTRTRSRKERANFIQ